MRAVTWITRHAQVVGSGTLVLAGVAIVATAAIVPERSVEQAVAAAAPSVASPEVGPQPRAVQPRSSQRRLYIPPIAPSRVEDGVRTIDLTAQHGTVVRYGETLDTAGFNGGYLAPTIRVRRGERVRMRVRNELTEVTTVHWHGLRVPAQFDGGPYQPIAQGDEWNPEFTLVQPASTLWYHPHLMGATARQVGRGMAGFFIIDDSSRGQRALPRRYGVDDIPVLLQGAPLPLDGNVDGRRPLLANGTPNAVHRTRAGRVRLRLLNASAGAMLGITVRGGQRAWVVASDGGLLPAPVATRRIVLGPSERGEVVVDMQPGRSAQLVATILPDRGRGARTAARDFQRGRVSARDTGSVLTIVNTARRLPARRALPRRLRSIAKVDTSAATLRPMVLGPTIQINGELMHHAELGADNGIDTIEAVEGVPEVWAVQNRSDLTHVFHVHDTQFTVVDRNGARPVAVERGEKDSIHLLPGETVRIAMRFDHFTDPTWPYMYHCHVLRHEDAGMMGDFVVLPQEVAA